MTTSFGTIRGLLILTALVGAFPAAVAGQSAKSSSVRTTDLTRILLPLTSAKGPAITTIEGPVTNIQGNILQISGGVQVDVSQATFFDINGQEQISASSIAMGTMIVAGVTSSTDSGTVPQAQVVLVQLANEGHLIGPLQAVDTTNQTITLLNLPIQVTDQTQFPLFGGQKPPIEKLKVGRLLAVSFQSTSSGLVAIQVIQLPKEVAVLVPGSTN